MSFRPYTEKLRRKKFGICSIFGRIRIHHPGNGSADPDLHQNDTDPKHWKNGLISYFCGGGGVRSSCFLSLEDR